MEGYGRAYPGPVSSHNLVCPLLRFLVPCPREGQFIFLATTVVVVSLVGTGPPRTKPRRGVGPPEWEYEAMGSVVWVQCATSAECINLSIAESTVTDTLIRLQHIYNF